MCLVLVIFIILLILYCCKNRHGKFKEGAEKNVRVNPTAIYSIEQEYHSQEQENPSYDSRRVDETIFNTQDTHQPSKCMKKHYSIIGDDLVEST